MRLGVLGGTFDPIHLGHLVIAEEARLQVGLERVLFIPTGQPWLRAGQPISPAPHRLEMTRLAVQGTPCFAVSSTEVERPGPSYTVETLEQLHRNGLPGFEDPLDIYFILGVDSLAEFHRWKEPARILTLCTLVAMARPGYMDFDLRNVETMVSGVLTKTIMINTPWVGISSTELRRRVARGVSIRYWVPESVEAYIRQHGLYHGDQWEGKV